MTHLVPGSSLSNFSRDCPGRKAKCLSARVNHIEFNEIYEESVYQVRLKVAITLLVVPGITQRQAVIEADKFVDQLLGDNAEELKRKWR